MSKDETKEFKVSNTDVEEALTHVDLSVAVGLGIAKTHPSKLMSLQQTGSTLGQVQVLVLQAAGGAQ